MDWSNMDDSSTIPSLTSPKEEKEIPNVPTTKNFENRKIENKKSGKSGKYIVQTEVVSKDDDSVASAEKEQFLDTLNHEIKDSSKSREPSPSNAQRYNDRGRGRTNRRGRSTPNRKFTKTTKSPSVDWNSRTFNSKSTTTDPIPYVPQVMLLQNGSLQPSSDQNVISLDWNHLSELDQKLGAISLDKAIQLNQFKTIGNKVIVPIYVIDKSQKEFSNLPIGWSIAELKTTE